MTVQTSYSVYHGEKYPGMVINVIDAVSRYNNTDASIPFGYGVVYDGDGNAKLPESTDTALTFEGIAMREMNRVVENDDFGAKADQDFTVVTAAGKVAVVAGATVATNDAVYLGVGVDVAGKFTNAAGTGDTLAVLISNAKFLEAGADGEATWIKFS